jgi:hypothetical protein
MVPAAVILLVRQIEPLRGETSQRALPRWMYLPLIGGAVMSVLVCRADYTLAQAGRRAAETISEKLEAYKGRVWFQGHWGFQYYMEAAGAKALNQDNPHVGVGDIIISPLNNTNTRSLTDETVNFGESFEFDVCGWLATMSPSLGAGFYSDVWGPLPYAFGRVEPEGYYAFIAKSPGQ